MKKCLFTLLIGSFVFFSDAQAQINKGATFLGGNVGTSVYKNSDRDSTLHKERQWFASATYGKAIKENLILGGSAYWQYLNIDREHAISDLKRKTWGLGVFLRKYKQLGKTAFSVFAEGNAGWQSMHENSMDFSGNDVITRGWSTAITAYPGISYAVSKKIQLETGFLNLLELRYSTSKSKTTLPGAEETKTNDFAFSSSIRRLGELYLGFRVLLN